MEITLKKFDMDAYTTRRLKELRGERVYSECPHDALWRYTQRRMREIYESLEDERGLDKSILGCYTVGRMGDHDGKS
tara:strand:- start:406 stop:636 length:231 start_codon:yes stop_codon:yes gene_type:complete